MASRLAPSQRLAYEHLRVLTQDIVVRHVTVPQRVLAESIGVHQTTVSNVLNGRITSIVTLESIGRALLPMVSGDDQRLLLDELALVMPFVRQPRR